MHSERSAFSTFQPVDQFAQNFNAVYNKQQNDRLEKQ
jgi:hypothetical protein